MSTVKSTIRFLLRLDKKDESNKAPVYLLYQHKGDKTGYAVPKGRINIHNWDGDNQRAIFVDRKEAKTLKQDFNTLLSYSDVKEFNSKLETLERDVLNAEKLLVLSKEKFDTKRVIDQLKENLGSDDLTIKKQKGTPISSFIYKRIIEDSRGSKQPGTLKAYAGLAAHVSSYGESISKVITFESIDAPTLKAFHNFLTTADKLKSAPNKRHPEGLEYKNNMNNVTAAKQISTLKTIINIARKDYKINVNPDYKDYTTGRNDSQFEVIALTQDEFEALYNLDLSSNKRLDQVRDAFCFSCTTGLRYSDLAQLKREHIKRDNTIRLTTEKGAKSIVIPLNFYSQSILNKYSDHLRPLPMITNQKCNEYLKELGQLAGIDSPIEIVRKRGATRLAKVYKKYELLSMHDGRRTFITLSLEKGIPIQDVMSLSGHSTFKSFKRYVNVTDSRKKTVMAEAWGKVDSNLKAV